MSKRGTTYPIKEDDIESSLDYGYAQGHKDATLEAARIAEAECKRLGGVGNPKDALVARRISNRIFRNTGMTKLIKRVYLYYIGDTLECATADSGQNPKPKWNGRHGWKPAAVIEPKLRRSKHGQAK